MVRVIGWLPRLRASRRTKLTIRAQYIGWHVVGAIANVMGQQVVLQPSFSLLAQE